MATKVKKLYTSTELFDLVVKKYPEPAYVALAEVCNGTGSQANRWADAVVFGVWPSRGLQIIGFEFKSGRSDWRREIERPDKADSVSRYCDEWWIVGADDVVKLEEVPKTWGWYTPKNRVLKAMKQPGDAKPRAVDRSFLMSIARNITRGFVPQHKVTQMVKEGKEALIERERDRSNWELKDLRKLKKRAEEFRKASGMDIVSDWGPNIKEMGDIVKALRDGDVHYNTTALAKIAKNMHALSEQIAKLPFVRPEEVRR